MDNFEPENMDNDARYIKLANEISNESNDPSTKVGAVLVSPDNTQTVFGYNRFPSRIPDREAWWNNRDESKSDFAKYDLACCAEVDAISKARTDLDGWSLYLTHFPCLYCAKLITHVGIDRVVYQNEPSKIHKTINSKKVERLFIIAGVQFDHFPSQ